MIHTTTPRIEGRTVTDYHGVVTGEAIIGIDIDYETVGERGAMLMDSISGTAVSVS